MKKLISSQNYQGRLRNTQGEQNEKAETKMLGICPNKRHSSYKFRMQYMTVTHLLLVPLDLPSLHGISQHIASYCNSVKFIPSEYFLPSTMRHTVALRAYGEEKISPIHDLYCNTAVIWIF